MSSEIEAKRLPKVLLLRTQNILRKEVSELYPTGIKNTVKAVLTDGSTTYVDIVAKKEVPAATLKINVEDWGKEDTLKLTGKEAEKEENSFDLLVSRDDVIEKPKKKTAPKKGAKKTPSKKSSK